MRKCSFILAALLMNGVAGAQTTAQPSPGTSYVRFDRYTTTGQRVLTPLFQVSGQSSNINLSTGQQHLLVTASANGDPSGQPVIGSIFISGGPTSGTAPIQVLFASEVPCCDFPGIPTGSSGDVFPSLIGRGLGGLGHDTVRPVAFYGGVNGALTGSLNVNQLSLFRAAGAINASISSDANFSGNFAWVDGASIVADVSLGSSLVGRVQANSGALSGNVSARTILLARSVTGDVTGDLTATTLLQEVRAAGAIGNTSGTSTITGQYVNRVVAGGQIQAMIKALAAASNADLALQLLAGTTFSGSLDVSRAEKLGSQTHTNAINFSGDSSGTVNVRDAVNTPIRFGGGVSAGSISLGALNSSVSVNGSLNGDMTIASSGSASSVSVTSNVSAGKTIRITGDHAGSLSVGGSLSGTVVIDGSLAATGSVLTGSSGNPGLIGQVFINAGLASGQWNGTCALAARVER